MGKKSRGGFALDNEVAFIHVLRYRNYCVDGVILLIYSASAVAT